MHQFAYSAITFFVPYDRFRHFAEALVLKGGNNVLCEQHLFKMRLLFECAVQYAHYILCGICGARKNVTRRRVNYET